MDIFALFPATFPRILKHECIVCGKVSCSVFATQLIFQLLPLSSYIFYIMSWIVLPIGLIMGFRSDILFYSKYPDRSTKLQRLLCNIFFFLTFWFITIYFFHYLSLPWTPDKEKDILQREGNAPVAVAGVVLEEILDNEGFVRGLVLLLFAHLAAVITLVTFVRSVVFGLEDILIKLMSYIPVPVLSWKKTEKSE